MSDSTQITQETLGQRITAAREKAGISTTEFARVLGVRTSTVSAWELDHSEPRSNKLAMLAGALNVSLIWLLKGDDEIAGVARRT